MELEVMTMEEMAKCQKCINGYDIEMADLIEMLYGDLESSPFVQMVSIPVLGRDGQPRQVDKPKPMSLVDIFVDTDGAVQVVPGSNYGHLKEELDKQLGEFVKKKGKLRKPASKKRAATKEKG